MPFAEEIRARLPKKASVPPLEADARLERLAAICPVYRDLIGNHPEHWAWVEQPQNRDETFRFSAFLGLWREAADAAGLERAARAAALRRFRRRMCFRAAYREVNELCPVAETLAELSLLAEFVLREALVIAVETWTARLGEPWDGEHGKPARLCVLALGKLGAQEINFCSDVDLIFFYQGEGHCRRGGKPGAVDNGEFFSRLARDFCALLQEHTEDGFLYNVDLRLRPEGDAGPLVRSWDAMANYYWAAGQPWERFAFIRARPVAGNLNLGLELLEELNPFRYPRAVSPALLQDVAGVKARLEREVSGAARLERDIKYGRGGIREIEFLVQSRQLLEGGRNPFLQTHQLAQALERLARYKLVPEKDAAALRDAYYFLRLVENRLQMREEQATHELPPEGPEREALARSFGMKPAAFEQKLARARAGVRQQYESLFPESPREAEIQEWTLFLSGREPAPALAEKLARWFPKSDNAVERLRHFALGSGGALAREQVSLFLDVAGQFDALLPRLARPLAAIERLAQFGESYGARRQFFQALASNPGLFQALGLLFDRSTAIHAWLCAHPGIMEELLHEAPRRRKTPGELAAEIAPLAREAEEFPRLLWLYVKAEQVRAAMADLLFAPPSDEIETRLTELADAALAAALRIADPGGRLAVIALGKYGGGELGIGSDLDLILLGPQDDLAGDTTRANQLRKLLSHTDALGRALELDLRLRPHGEAGPLVTTLPALRAYHAPGGGAQGWERQLLTRARFAAGNPVLAEELFAWRDGLIYQRPAPAGAREELQHMRQRIEEEKTKGCGPARAFKAGAGGLLDVEFAAQWLQLEHGAAHPALRAPGTRAALRAARGAGALDAADADALLEHYEFLRAVELALRRDAGTGVAVLPEEPRAMEALAVWLGRPGAKNLEQEMQQHRAEVRQIYQTIVPPTVERN